MADDLFAVAPLKLDAPSVPVEQTSYNPNVGLQLQAYQVSVPFWSPSFSAAMSLKPAMPKAPVKEAISLANVQELAADFYAGDRGYRPISLRTTAASGLPDSFLSMTADIMNNWEDPYTFLDSESFLKSRTVEAGAPAPVAAPEGPLAAVTEAGKPAITGEKLTDKVADPVAAVKTALAGLPGRAALKAQVDSLRAAVDAAPANSPERIAQQAVLNAKQAEFDAQTMGIDSTASAVALRWDPKKTTKENLLRTDASMFDGVTDPVIAASVADAVGSGESAYSIFAANPTTQTYQQLGRVDRGVVQAVDSTVHAQVVDNFGVDVKSRGSALSGDPRALPGVITKIDSALEYLGEQGLTKVPTYHKLQAFKAEAVAAAGYNKATQVEYASARESMDGLLTKSVGPHGNPNLLEAEQMLQEDALSKLRQAIGENQRMAAQDPSLRAEADASIAKAKSDAIRSFSLGVQTLRSQPGESTFAVRYKADGSYDSTNWENIFAGAALGLSLYGQTIGAERQRKQNIKDQKGMMRFEQDLANEASALRFSQQQQLQAAAIAGRASSGGGGSGRGAPSGSVISSTRM